MGKKGGRRQEAGGRREGGRREDHTILFMPKEDRALMSVASPPKSKDSGPVVAYRCPPITKWGPKYSPR